LRRESGKRSAKNSSNEFSLSSLHLYIADANYIDSTLRPYFGYKCLWLMERDSTLCPENT